MRISWPGDTSLPDDINNNNSRDDHLDKPGTDPWALPPPPHKNNNCQLYGEKILRHSLDEMLCPVESPSSTSWSFVPLSTSGRVMKPTTAEWGIKFLVNARPGKVQKINEKLFRGHYYSQINYIMDHTYYSRGHWWGRRDVDEKDAIKVVRLDMLL